MSSLDAVEAPRRRLDSAILLLALAMFGVASYLFLRALYIQYPVILADEELYALHAKFLNNPRFPIQMPNVFFFLVYHSASWFGENHFAFAKLLNAAFFAMSVLPLYAIARKFLSQPGAYLFSVAVVLAPISSYSVYVMPEAMFFFAFWILTYLLVVKLPADIIYGGIYLGLALAALSAIKPHGLIIAGTFPVVVGILYFASSGDVSLGTLVEASIGCVEALVVGRFAIQYLAHGDFSVLLFGNLYQEVSKPPPVAVALKWTAKTIHQPAMVLGLGHFLWHFAQGHLAYVSVLFWPALALVVWPAESVRGALEESLSYRLLRAFSLTALALLLAIVATVGVDFASLYEVELCRLHGRYYDFLFPALLLLFLARTRRNSSLPRQATLFRIITIGGAIAASALAYHSRLDYCVNFVDFPEIRWLASSDAHLGFAIAGCIVTAIAIASFNWTWARIACCGTLAVLALLSSNAIFRDQIAQVEGPPAEDLAAIAVRNLMRNQIDDGVVFSKVDHDPRSYRVMLQLYSLSRRRLLNQPALTGDDIPSGTKWILLLDSYRVEVPYYSRITERGFELVTLSPDLLSAAAGSSLESYPRFYDLSRTGAALVSLTGFNLPEEKSVWTRDPVARIYFDTPIAGKVELAIKAHAYGPNSGRPITLKVGNLERQVKFYGDDSEVGISGELKEPANYLELSGMLAISPSVFEHAADPRPLGIAISYIRIGRPEQSEVKTQPP